ncbi:unnamed protein product [Cylindrotheca closterium]|uniref:HMG box domain-containing protein n=1 Tax=Cylindrotheca closterium TaxID=2856 RepID=A0AAD2FKS9_9STRA|nr:unnamed protein product [Cylindrotheca closterium]
MNISLGNGIEPSVPPMLGGRNGSLADRMQTSPMLHNNEGGGISKQADLSKISSIIGGDSSTSSGFDDLKKLNSGGLFPILATKKATEKVEKVAKPATTENLNNRSSASSKEVEEKVTVTKKRRPRKKWKKPKDKPNRPLSAYNLFFQQERALMLGNGNPPKEDPTEVEVEESSETSGDNSASAKRRIHRKTHGKVGFAEMARSIGSKWKSLPDSDKEVFVKQASKEKERYAKELSLWKEQQKVKEQQQQEMANSIAASNAHNDSNQSNGVDAFADSATKQRLALLQDVTRGNTDLSTINILRALQGQQQQQQQHQPQQQLGSDSNSNNLKSYPNAAEASANAIFQQFQGLLSQQQPQPTHLNPFLLASQGGVSGGNDMTPTSSLSLAEQLQLNTVAQQRMQLERLQMQQLLLQNQMAMSNVAAQAPVSNNPSLDMLQQQMNQQFQPNNVGNGNQLNFFPNQQRP